MRKLVPPWALPPLPVQLLLPPAEREADTVAPLALVQVTVTDATATSSVAYTVHELVGAVPAQLPVQRMMSGASPPRVVFTVTVKLLFGPVTVTVAEYVPSPEGSCDALTFTPTVAVPDGASVPLPGPTLSQSVPSPWTDHAAEQLAGLKMMNELLPPGPTFNNVVFE